MRREPSPSAYAGVGSREAPIWATAFATGLARRLAARGLVCRTGEAVGMDEAFLLGAAGRAETYLARPARNRTGPIRLARPTLEAIRIAAEHHPKWRRLRSFERELIARDTHQILGPFCDEPSLFVACWTPDGAERGEDTSEWTGGTGQAIRVASAFGVPVFNLANESSRHKLEKTDGLLRELSALAQVPKTLPVDVV